MASVRSALARRVSPPHRASPPHRRPVRQVEHTWMGAAPRRDATPLHIGINLETNLMYSIAPVMTDVMPLPSFSAGGVFRHPRPVLVVVQ